VERLLALLLLLLALLLRLLIDKAASMSCECQPSFPRKPLLHLCTCSRGIVSAFLQPDKLRLTTKAGCAGQRSISQNPPPQPASLALQQHKATSCLLSPNTIAGCGLPP
jgi:hypothetical protein